jgi:GT2 family glycosyltransferase
MKKIAVLTVFCNEDFRIENWKTFYSEYQDEIDYHVIINNGNENDNAVLKQAFPDSVVLYSAGKNLLRAYNVGLKYVYDNYQVDAVMQITNDIRFERGSITKLKEKLFADERLAVIGPVVMAKDSTIIESYGYKTYGYWGPQKPINCGKDYSELTTDFQYVTFVPAGVIMIKADAWKKIGYQDERLEMYCDEWDMFIRFKEIGYKEGALTSAKAWHQHIARPGFSVPRSYDAFFKAARNHIFITRKYCGFGVTLLDFVYSCSWVIFLMISHVLRIDVKKLGMDYSSLKGFCVGLVY